MHKKIITNKIDLGFPSESISLAHLISLVGSHVNSANITFEWYRDSVDMFLCFDREETDEEFEIRLAKERIQDVKKRERLISEAEKLKRKIAGEHSTH